MCVSEVLRNNFVEPVAFAVSQCKTILLPTLGKVFKTFVNPANNEYSWLGAENAELTLLNYFSLIFLFYTS